MLTSEPHTLSEIEEIFIELSAHAISEAENGDQSILLSLLEIKLGQGLLLDYLKHRLTLNKQGHYFNKAAAHRPKQLTPNKQHFKWYCLARYYQLKEGLTFNKAILKMINNHEKHLNEETVRSSISRLRKNFLSPLFSKMGGEPDIETITSWCIKYKYLMPPNTDKQ